MIAVPVALFVAVACTTQTRHEWLDYFLDGVPPLNGGISRAPVMTAETVDAASPSLSSPRAKPAKPKYYNHPEYFANRCDGCHASEFGELRMTPREGLCSSCHPDKPPKKEFVHGPVAVNGCLACHRYHKSLYPKVLIADAQELCFHCHETDQMRTDEHHATIETERCIDCHDPHGGDDRFFLIKKPESVDST
ncbi:MAG: cytochrome c3 family protein [Phycisphaerae bacterium]|jgi:predicted CXXCH cytochrome family protein